MRIDIAKHEEANEGIPGTQVVLNYRDYYRKDEIVTLIRLGYDDKRVGEDAVDRYTCKAKMPEANGLIIHFKPGQKSAAFLSLEPACYQWEDNPYTMINCKIR